MNHSGGALPPSSELFLIWTNKSTGATAVANSITAPPQHDDLWHRHSFWLVLIFLNALVFAIIGYFIGILKGQSIVGVYSSTTTPNDQSSTPVRKPTVKNMSTFVPPKMPSNALKSKTNQLPLSRLSVILKRSSQEEQSHREVKAAFGKNELLKFLIQQRAERESAKGKGMSTKTQSDTPKNVLHQLKREATKSKHGQREADKGALRESSKVGVGPGGSENVSKVAREDSLGLGDIKVEGERPRKTASSELCSFHTALDDFSSEPQQQRHPLRSNDSGESLAMKTGKDLNVESFKRKPRKSSNYR